MTDRIFRYEVPVDDRPHTLPLSGAVLHVACRQVDVVELWALESGGPPIERAFQVVGTGQPLPDRWFMYRGTAIAPGGQLVWHLMEVPR